MATVHWTRAFRQLRGLLAAQETAALTEADLWDRYVRERDEAAFEVLVRRLGPMVLGVCRRILGNAADAEDAFQATFLVLVRKASSLRSPRTLAGWLHGVARRTALAARSCIARRRAKEAALLPRVVVPEDTADDLRATLDEELGRLAEKYRIAVVLCDLEGKTRKEAAHQLGWAEGTVASRLARGRGLLAQRLARRGFAGSLVAAALAGETASACVPSGLVVSTVRAASCTAAQAAAQGVLSGSAAALTEGVLRSMLLTKLKCAIAVVLAVAIATVGARALTSLGGAAEPQAPPARGQAQEQTDRDDFHDRLADLKQQLGQLQAKIARLEQEAPARPRRNDPRGAFLASRFKYRVRFETGYTETRDGGRLEIQEVWGTQPRIVEGGQYLVHGKYVLPAGQRGKLYFFETATGDWGRGPTPIMDLQTTSLDSEKGEFTLMHGMAGPGYFHLVLTKPERYSHMFANVYFGTGDNVLRTKP
jgi:RNA polymerase sigma factor (sigma-70 family)